MSDKQKIINIIDILNTEFDGDLSRDLGDVLYKELRAQFNVDKDRDIVHVDFNWLVVLLKEMRK
jgi:hypothetical protein